MNNTFARVFLFQFFLQACRAVTKHFIGQHRKERAYVACSDLWHLVGVSYIPVLALSLESWIP